MSWNNLADPGEQITKTKLFDKCNFFVSSKVLTNPPPKPVSWPLPKHIMAIPFFDVIIRSHSNRFYRLNNIAVKII